MKAQNIFAEFQEIYGYIGQGYFTSTVGKLHTGIVIVLLFIIMLSTLLLLLIWCFKKPKTVWQQALEQIEQAWQQQQNGTKPLQDFYADLTEVVKLLVERRLNLQVRTTTDAELMVLLQQQQEDLAFVATMQEFLVRAQTVKFANKSQIQDQLLQDIAMIKQAVQECAQLKATTTNKAC